MIEELKEKIMDKWNDMSVKTKVIGAVVIAVVIIAIISS
jgi:flagellar biosynthesis/type III secretory pathway M-ring protein FliF/YscJ